MENAGTTSITGAVRLVHVLKIESFSTTAKMNSCIKSRWTVDGYDWQICVWTCHKVELNLKFLSKSREGITSATLGCQVIDPRGKTEPSEEKTMTQIFSRYNDHSDMVQLMRRDELVTSGYLMDDTLALRCTITVLKELRVPTITSKQVIALPSTNLHEHLGALLRSETGADVTFLVRGESFAAHKDILAARSPVFKAQFFGDMKEKCSVRVEVEDIEVAAFRAMLHFIYTDTAPELDQPLEEGTAMAQHLLAASDRYKLDRLKLICEIKLSGGINVETAATTLALAEQHNCSKLKAKCIEFIVSTPAVLGAVLATEGYKHLEASCPLVLTELLKSVHVRKS